MILYINNAILNQYSKIFLFMALGFLLILSSGCTNSGQVKLQELKLASLSDMPDYVQEAAPEVQEAYQFAAANPEVLEHIPCYCGCNLMGHMNNTECYVKTFNPDGSVAEFDNHATS